MGNANAGAILGFRILVSAAGIKQIITDFWSLYLYGIWAREKIIRCFSEPSAFKVVLTIKQHGPDGSGDRFQSGPVLFLSVCFFVLLAVKHQSFKWEYCCQNLAAPCDHGQLCLKVGRPWKQNKLIALGLKNEEKQVLLC